jgi:hypothetical protein
MAQRKKRVKPAPAITGGEAISPPAVVNTADNGGQDRVNESANPDGDAVMASLAAAVGQEEVLVGVNCEKGGSEGQEVEGDIVMVVDTDHADDALVEDAI